MSNISLWVALAMVFLCHCAFGLEKGQFKGSDCFDSTRSGHSSLDVIIDSCLAAAVVMILNCVCGVCTSSTALNEIQQ